MKYGRVREPKVWLLYLKFTIQKFSLSVQIQNQINVGQADGCIFIGFLGARTERY